MTTQHYIRWITDTAAPAVAIVGGKGASLHKLTSFGLRVPDAFVVTTAAYRDAIAGSLVAEIDRRTNAVANTSDLDELTVAATSIRDLLFAETEGNVADAAVRDSYAALAERLGGEDPSVAVRSSSAAEDSAAHSFAGEHDSYLWVLGADVVSEAVRRCWASLYTARAMSYRVRNGMTATDDAMAVVVQHMVDARAAGVFMTLNPVNGDRSKIVVESLWGLGEPLVSGTATPDRFVIDKVTGEVIERSIARKELRASRNAATGQGIEMLQVNSDDVERPSLMGDELTELIDVARRVEKQANCPQDGEFALMDSDIYLLQARPETVWSTKAANRISDNSNAMSHVLSVLTNGAKTRA